jgi:hypothetical protein
MAHDSSILVRPLPYIHHRTRVVPSHGDVGDRDSVLEFLQMLETTRVRVQELIAQNYSEVQAMMDPSFEDLDDRWGQAFVPGPVFRSMVYEDLTRSWPSASCQ